MVSALTCFLRAHNYLMFSCWAKFLVSVLPGHRKAVSYVRYLNNSELVSASTDSTLRMWDTKACTAARTFSGHNNEKNFVGLSVDADFIACGSESNEVCFPS